MGEASYLPDKEAQMQFTTEFGDRLSVYRRRTGMTQDALASRLGVSAQAVSKWERAVCCPDISLLPALADTFGISIDLLFGRSA